MRLDKIVQNIKDSADEAYLSEWWEATVPREQLLFWASVIEALEVQIDDLAKGYITHPNGKESGK